MNYTTYLFDFDYTLADSSRGIVTCFHNVLLRHGYTLVTDEEIKRTIGKTLQDSFSILTGVTDKELLESFRKEYSKEADTHMTLNTFFFLETKSVLIALKDAGVRIGIISTKYRYRIKEVLDQHFTNNFFDIIIGGEDVQEHKPSPEGLLSAIKQLRVNKAEVLYIGDSTVDAQTAQAAGVDFAGITHGITTTQELSQFPHKRIMTSLEELLEPEHPQPPIPSPISETVFQRKEAIASQQKRINNWQILLLFLLLWLTCVETPEEASYLLTTVFILTLWGMLQHRRILPHRIKQLIAPWWNPCAARLRMLHIKLIQGKTKRPIDNDTCTCLNCNNIFIGNYCNHCGQNRNVSRYHLKNALQNSLGGLFSIDSGFGRTLLELLYRPGHMIRDFIGGKRVHYFRPFQTLFVLAALYIMFVQLIDPSALTPKTIKEENAQTELINKLAANNSIPDSLNHSLPISPEKIETTIAYNLITTQNSLKEKAKAYLQDYPFLMRVWHLLKGWSHGNKAFQILATLPLFALSTLLVFRRKKYRLCYNLTEHIFIQTYIACQILLISILVLPFSGHAQTNSLYEVPSGIIFLLFCWNYKQLHHCTWWRSFWSTSLMVCYTLALTVLSAILLAALIAITSTIME